MHFRSATDFEGGAFRLLSGGGAAASLAEPDAGNTLSPSKREQRRQMAEALLGAEHDAQARQSVSSCFKFSNRVAGISLPFILLLLRNAAPVL